MLLSISEFEWEDHYLITGLARYIFAIKPQLAGIARMGGFITLFPPCQTQKQTQAAMALKVQQTPAGVISADRLEDKTVLAPPAHHCD